MSCVLHFLHCYEMSVLAVILDGLPSSRFWQGSCCSGGGRRPLPCPGLFLAHAWNLLLEPIPGAPWPLASGLHLALPRVNLKPQGSLQVLHPAQGAPHTCRARQAHSFKTAKKRTLYKADHFNHFREPQVKSQCRTSISTSHLDSFAFLPTGALHHTTTPLPPAPGTPILLSVPMKLVALGILYD